MSNRLPEGPERLQGFQLRVFLAGDGIHGGEGAPGTELAVPENDVVDADKVKGVFEERTLTF